MAAVSTLGGTRSPAGEDRDDDRHRSPRRPRAAPHRAALPPGPDGATPAAARRRRRDGRRRAAAGDLLGVAAWASAAVAVALWLASPGSHAVSGLSGWLTDAGIVAGLVATDLVLVMLVLAARVPLLDRVFGQDTAIAVHRSLGKPVLYCWLAHGVLLTLGYGAASGSGPVAATISLFSTPDMPLAYLGLGLFLVVVVSSVVAVRRHLPYEAWHVGAPAQLRRRARGPAAHAQRLQRPRQAPGSASTGSPRTSSRSAWSPCTASRCASW